MTIEPTASRRISLGVDGAVRHDVWVNQRRRADLAYGDAEIEALDRGLTEPTDAMIQGHIRWYGEQELDARRTRAGDVGVRPARSSAEDRVAFIANNVMLRRATLRVVAPDATRVRHGAFAMADLLTPASDEAEDIARLHAGIEALCEAHQSPFLMGSDGTRLPIPPSLFGAIRTAVEAMSRGATITFAPVHKELTSQEAADLLLVSRPHLIKLLDRGDIAHHKVGRHRRVRLADVLAYRDARTTERERVLTELARDAQDMGGYD